MRPLVAVVCSALAALALYAFAATFDAAPSAGVVLLRVLTGLGFAGLVAAVALALRGSLRADQARDRPH